MLRQFHKKGLSAVYNCDHETKGEGQVRYIVRGHLLEFNLDVFISVWDTYGVFINQYKKELVTLSPKRKEARQLAKN